jgi:hypothetical protein
MVRYLLVGLLLSWPALAEDPVGPKPGEAPQQIVGQPVKPDPAADARALQDRAELRKQYLRFLEEANKKAAEAKAAYDAEVDARHAAENAK